MASQKIEPLREAEAVAQELFTQLKERYPRHKDLVQEVAAALQVEPSNCYKRIAGATALSVDDLIKLSRHFDLSLDELVADAGSRSLAIQGSPYRGGQRGFASYLKRTTQQLQALPGRRHRLLYYARDLPLFAHFVSASLARYRILAWVNSLRKTKDHIDIGDIEDELVEKALHLGALYQQLNTVELWTDRTMATLLRQIQEDVQHGRITAKFAKTLLKDVGEMLQTKQTACAAPAAEANQRMYKAAHLLSVNGALVETDDQCVALVSYSGATFQQVADWRFCQQQKEWYEQQMMIGVDLGENETAREAFFGDLFDQMMDLREEEQLAYH